MEKHQPHSSQKFGLKNSSEAVASRNESSSFTPEQESKVLLKEENEKAVVTEASLQRGDNTLSEQEIVNLVVHNTTVKAYQREVCHWSLLVFGNADALQEKIQQIQKDPALTETFSWQLAAHPKRFGKLSGVSVYGIKNEARKQAEKDLNNLCGVLRCYGEAIKTAKDALYQSPEKELRHYYSLIDSETMSKILRRSHFSEGEKKAFSEENVREMVQQHPSVQRQSARIEHWCQVVFGKSGVLQDRMRDILADPSKGENLVAELSENCRAFGKLSGVKILGIKNRVRRHAEAGISSLIDSVEAFGNIVQQVKENILHNHHAQQECPGPSAELAASLQETQGLSKSSESLSATKSREVPETSRQAQEEIQNIQSRKSSEIKALALAN